jgi:hypothetical protein
VPINYFLIMAETPSKNMPREPSSLAARAVHFVGWLPWLWIDQPAVNSTAAGLSRRAQEGLFRVGDPGRHPLIFRFSRASHALNLASRRGTSTSSSLHQAGTLRYMTPYSIFSKLV